MPSQPPDQLQGHTSEHPPASTLKLKDKDFSSVFTPSSSSCSMVAALGPVWLVLVYSVPSRGGTTFQEDDLSVLVSSTSKLSKVPTSLISHYHHHKNTLADQYPVNFPERKLQLIQSIKDSLKSDEAHFSEFKSHLGEFRQSIISAVQYYKSCQNLLSENFQRIFNEQWCSCPTELSSRSCCLYTDFEAKQGFLVPRAR
uniref:ZNF598/HEL2 PAH domain-containing protein n=1 Tax=Molossus molossus TaxID=27622 RepID=A0A7J8HD12_MOLMO|nr:hypothetical protein HJG59_011182 [Molossus molossus]